MHFNDFYENYPEKGIFLVLFPLRICFKKYFKNSCKPLGTQRARQAYLMR